MVASRPGFNSKTLNKLLKQPNSSVFLRKCERHIALPPSALSDINAAIHAHLNRILARFDVELDGVLIGFRNINVLTDLGAILNDSPHIHIDIEAEFYVFKPEKGSILIGVVKKKSRDNIGCLVHDLFNASIPLELEDEIDVDNIDIGEPLTFRVEEVDFADSLPYIKGKLVETQEEITNEQITMGKKRKRTDDHQLGKKIKTEIHSFEEEENIPNSFQIDYEFKLPTSILKKNNSVAIEGSPARKISFFGDIPRTSNEMEDIMKSPDEESPLKEKKKKKKKETENSPESPIPSKKIKMSVSALENELLGIVDIKGDERMNLSLPVKLKSKKKKNKLKEQEHEILYPGFEELKMDSSNESHKKTKKKKQNVFETEIPNFEDISANPSVMTDSSMQKLKKKVKKKVESLMSEQNEFKTHSDDDLLQSLHNATATKKKNRSISEPEADIQGSGVPNRVQPNEFLVEQKVKKMKKRKETNRHEEESETSATGIGERGVMKEHQKRNKKNVIESTKLESEVGDTDIFKINESSSRKQKTKKERKKHSQVMTPESSSEVVGVEWQNLYESFASDDKKKKTKKDKIHTVNEGEVTNKGDEKRHKSYQEHEKEDVYNNESLSSPLPDDTNIKKKKKKKDRGSEERSLLGLGEEDTRLKSTGIANSTIMASTESLKKKLLGKMNMSFDFLSPIKKTNNSPEIHDGEGFVTSTQIKTVPKTKRKSLSTKEGKSSSSNLPKSKELVSSSIPITLDSLSPIKKVRNSSESSEDNFGFITSTQLENVPQTKNIPLNTVKTTKSPSKSPPKKSSISSTSADLDNIIPSSKFMRENIFKKPRHMGSDSPSKSVTTKQLLKDLSDKESRSSNVPVRTMLVDSKKVDMKGAESSKLSHQLDMPSDSDSSSSMDLPSPKSLREAKESSNETANKIIKEKEIERAALKSGGSDSSSSDSDAPPPRQISAQQETREKSKVKGTSRNSGAPSPVKSDESSSSCSESDAPLSRPISAQQQARQESKIKKSSLNSGALRSVKSDESSSSSSCSDSDAPLPRPNSAQQRASSKAKKSSPRSVESNKSSTDVDATLGKVKPPDQSGKDFIKKSVNRKDESDIDSSDSDLPSHMQRTNEKSPPPVGTVLSSVSPRTSISVPSETLSPQNKISPFSSNSNRQKKKNKTVPSWQKNTVKENSDSALKGLSLYVKKSQSTQKPSSKSKDNYLGDLPLPKPLKEHSQGVKKHSDGDKSRNSDSGNVQPVKQRKSKKSKPVVEKINSRFDSHPLSHKPLKSNSGTSGDESTQNVIPSSNQGGKAASASKRTKLQLESHGHKTSESETDSLVKAMLQKIKLEKTAPSGDEKRKEAIKTSKQKLKQKIVTDPENKTEAKRKKTSKLKDTEDPLSEDMKKKQKKKTKLEFDPAALSIIAQQLLEKVK